MAERGAFDGMKVELSHGELIRMTPPHRPHASMQAQIIGKLYAALGSGEGLLGEVAVRLGHDTVRALDVGLVDPAAVERVVEPGEVRLAVEVSDTTLEEDIGPKARDYAAAEIATYWVVDVNARVVHVMVQPTERGYGRREVVRFGEQLSIPGNEATITLD
jgi:Uma2 family endonuclease